MNGSIPSLQLTPFADDFQGDAANDCNFEPDQPVTDVELLVATTVARVTARMQPEFVNVVLDLSAHESMVAGNPTSLAFALAGILGALLRAAEENGEDEVLRVVVTERHHVVRVSIAGPDVPPLRMIRALSGERDVGMADPTVAHCRRIVEREGGSLGLATCAGELAVELSLPCYPQDRGIRVLRPHTAARLPSTPPLARAIAC
jgi:hypothetical protein